MSHSLAVRFWSRVAIAGRDDCWEWKGYTTPYGYGQIGDGQRVLSTHRTSWELSVGPIPDGAVVCHKCDNPPCVNPDHLFIGTHQDNCDDKMRKGRHVTRRGTDHPFAKLTDGQINEIRARYRNGARYPSTDSAQWLAREFSITPQFVNQLARGIRRSSVA